MSENPLILTPLQKAVAALASAVNQPKNEFTRDATIQRFEYTFELAWKTVKRYLNMEAGVKEYGIKNIFRLAAKLGLIDNVESWFVYHEARNLTSHTYNEDTAEETYRVAKLFLPDVKKLLKALQIDHEN